MKRGTGIKSKIINTGIGLMAGLIFIGHSSLRAEDVTYIYLVDPTDQDTLKDLGLKPAATAPATQASTTKPAVKGPRTLDQVIQEQNQVVLTDRQKRIVTKVLADQSTFVIAMNGFLKSKFDARDDKAEPDFNAIRDKIVALVFDAPDEKIYYERIYLINKIWLENQNQAARFSALDHALRDKWLALEDHRRHIRTVITTTTTVIGVCVGSFLSYKASMKIFPVVADEKGFASIAKWAARGTVILIGAGVGMAAGEYAGFLGSDLLVKAQRDYIQPIDGTEDLRDILDVIDALPG